jgi:hypothetical protein
VSNANPFIVMALPSTPTAMRDVRVRTFVHAYSARRDLAALPRATTSSALRRPRRSKSLMFPRSVPAAYTFPASALFAITGGIFTGIRAIGRPVAARSTCVAVAMRVESSRARCSARATSADRGRTTPVSGVPGIQRLYAPSESIATL